MFCFGAVWGSFFNVCIYRLPLGRGVNTPSRSFCPTCGTMIAWYDNIPLVSYVALGGLCRHCGCRINIRYWLVELLTAVLFTAVFWVHRYSLATPLFLFFTAVLIVSTFTDLDHWIIPDSVSLGGAVAGIVAALAISVAAATGRWPHLGRSLYVAYPFATMGPWGIAASAVTGAALGFFSLWLVGVLGTLAFRKEAMGMGDMKLFACVGAFVGWQGSLLVLALASFIGATLGLSLMSAQWIVAKLFPATAGVPAEGPGPVRLETPPGTPDQQPASAEAASGSPADPSTTPPRRRPKGRQLHHLPFGPYIAVAGYVVALFYRPMTEWLINHLLILDWLGRR